MDTPYIGPGGYQHCQGGEPQDLHRRDSANDLPTELRPGGVFEPRKCLSRNGRRSFAGWALATLAQPKTTSTQARDASESDQAWPMIILQ